MNWPIRSLAEVAPIRPRKPESFDGVRRYYSTGAVGKNGELDAPELVTFSERPSRANCMPRIGDVGFARMNGTQKVVLINEAELGSMFSTGFCFLEPIDALDPKYLFYFLTSDGFQSAKNALAGEGIMGGIKNADVANMQIPLPPLSAQKRIVRLLDEAFEGIAIAKANAEKNFQNARALFGSHLQTVFTHGTDEWQSMRLGDVCSLISRGISPSYAEDGDIIVLNQRCVRNHQVDLEQSRRHSSHIRSVAPARFVQRGDVLVNSTGVGTLGRVGQIKTVPVAPITVDSHVTILRPKVDLFTEAFFGYMLISIESEITLLGQGSGGQTELAKSALSAMKVAWPTSLAEQQRIVSELNALVASSEVLTSTYVKKLAALDALVQSLLKHSFSGDLVAA